MVRTDVTANVWELPAKAGDRVVADDTTLVVLEAMKLEIPILTSVSGTIEMVCVEEGQMKQKGDALFVIKLDK